MKKVILVVLLSLSTSSCVFRAMPKCELPEESSLESCSEPVRLPEKRTFSESLEAHLADRESLAKCKIKHSALVQALNSCNNRIDKYNELRGKLKD